MPERCFFQGEVAIKKTVLPGDYLNAKRQLFSCNLLFQPLRLTIPSGNTSYTISGLSPEASYDVWIATVTAVGEGRGGKTAQISANPGMHKAT